MGRNAGSTTTRTWCGGMDMPGDSGWLPRYPSNRLPSPRHFRVTKASLFATFPGKPRIFDGFTLGLVVTHRVPSLFCSYSLPLFR